MPQPLRHTDGSSPHGIYGWGATDEEAQERSPGDDVVKNPTQISTRAETIDALPEEVWPWLVQLGQGRGGQLRLD